MVGLKKPSGPMLKTVKTLFLSDVHLGTRGCKATALLDFLKSHEAETIYLIGDIVDGWRLKSTWYWPQAHNDVVQKVLRQARKGTRVVYVPGNHDEFLRDYVGSNFGGIEVVEEAVHEMVDGRRMLILHGDKFDTVVRNTATWIEAQKVAGLTLEVVRLEGRTPVLFFEVAATQTASTQTDWSFSAYAKKKVKKAVSFISCFEETVVTDAARHGVDAVMCGHIHQPVIRQMGPIQYFNTGDWVESCSGILEHLDGSFELVHWKLEEQKTKAPERLTYRPAA